MKTKDEIRTELRWLFDAYKDDDGFVTIYVDDDTPVYIEFYNFNDSDDIETTEGFCIHSGDYECSAMSVDKAVDYILYAKQGKEDMKNSRKELDKFYEEKLAGHTKEEIKKGNDIHSIMWDAWDKKTDFVDFLNAECDNIIANMGLPLEETRKLLELSFDFETYSDWFKSLNGYRPRNVFI